MCGLPTFIFIFISVIERRLHKDAKLLCRTAERNGKARLATTHDVYSFCATMLPWPRREGATADEVVAPLPAATPPTTGTPSRCPGDARHGGAMIVHWARILRHSDSSHC